MGSLLNLVWSTARPSLRRPGLACVAATSFVGLLAFAQESTPLRQLGLQFAWDSCRDALVVALLAFGFVESTGWGTERTRWESRTSPGPLLYTVYRFAATMLGLIFVAAGSMLVFITLDRILVDAGSGGRPVDCLSQALCVALPLAAWTPAVAGVAVRTSLPTAVLWAVVVGLSLGGLGVGVPLPLDRLPPLGDGGGRGLVDLLPASLLGTAAGLCVTSALIPVYPPHTPSCGSASSATSTATSKH